MLTDLATKVALKTKPQQDEQQVFIDPATISLFMTIISQIVNMIKYCRAKRDETLDESVTVAVRMFNKPSRRETNALRRMLRRKMGWRTYWRDNNKTMNALLETGKETSVNEVTEVWHEV